MRFMAKLSLSALALVLLVPLGGCSCGFDCNSDNNNDNDKPAVLTLGLSDALPEDLKQVIIEVDTITFKRSGSDDIPVENFSINDGVSVPTFQVNLLAYPGVKDLVVIKDKEMPVGTYDSIEIKIVVGDLNNSKVRLQDDSEQVLTVENGLLQVPGMQLKSGNQKFVVEFALAQALRQQTEDFLLTNTGIRVENTATAATLSGEVATNLFNSVGPCSGKTNPQSGNRVYLYQASTATSSRLGDVFSNSTDVPANVRAPFAVASLTSSGDLWKYDFGYVPAGDYTMAFACDTQNDNPVTYDNLTIPLPANQRYPISLSAGENAVCDITDAGTC